MHPHPRGIDEEADLKHPKSVAPVFRHCQSRIIDSKKLRTHNSSPETEAEARRGTSYWKPSPCAKPLFSPHFQADSYIDVYHQPILVASQPAPALLTVRYKNPMLKSVNLVDKPLFTVKLSLMQRIQNVAPQLTLNVNLVPWEPIVPRKKAAQLTEVISIDPQPRGIDNEFELKDPKSPRSPVPYKTPEAQERTALHRSSLPLKISISSGGEAQDAVDNQHAFPTFSISCGRLEEAAYPQFIDQPRRVRLDATLAGPFLAQALSFFIQFLRG
ncbi:hypothetical protein JR316_0000178 [Psilocybe cubensis]|uniref:Uncharacterized protein n=2 Tax=Psilocybe cubensis TaxID=181762 RepID=A0A8H7Y4D2_PSICU|nr:hypothetical protein JR316_0000178 [Psilocybe cubensis]KAH9486114.1 hypothetical protein JR316_0000178 [Psilocybe cubensis]